MKKTTNKQMIIGEILKANNFEFCTIQNYKGIIPVFYRGEINKVSVFNDMEQQQFCITYECKHSKKIKEYRINFKEHQSINKVLTRIELLLNKKLKYI